MQGFLLCHFILLRISLLRKTCILHKMQQKTHFKFFFFHILHESSKQKTFLINLEYIIIKLAKKIWVMVHCPLQNLELELTDHMISISELKTIINYRTFVNLLDVYFPDLNVSRFKFIQGQDFSLKTRVSKVFIRKF